MHRASESCSKLQAGLLLHMAEEHDNHSYEWGLPCDHVLYDLKATSHKPYIQNQKNESTQSRLRIFFILSGEPKLCTFSFLILSFRATLLITWMVWSTPEIRRHATTVPSRLHCNKVCSSHSYSLNQIWTGDTGIYVMKCHSIPVLMSLPGGATILCMYFRPERATCVTSLELLQ